MDSGEYVVFNQLFAYKDSVFVVVTFPGHKAYENVTSESEFSVLSGGSVGKHVAGVYFVAFIYYRALVDTSALVASSEFLKFVYFFFTVFFEYDDFVRGDRLNGTRFFSDDTYAGVVRYLIFHTRSYHGGFGTEQRNSLTLHVTTHKSAVCVVVFKEGNKAGRYRYELFRVDVHVIYFACGIFLYIFAATARNAGVNEAAVFGKGFVSLSYDVLIFFVRRKIIDVVGYYAGSFINFTVRSFDKSVFVDFRVGRQGSDKTDVLTFRSFDRTHSSVMGVVNVTNFEAGSFSVKSARSECGKFTLVSKFRNGVRLIHKLGQLAASEKFSYSGRHGSYVYKGLRSNFVGVLSYAHSFLDYSFESGYTDTELVLEKFSHASYSTIAQMVDIVAEVESVLHSEIVAYGSHDIVGGYVFYHKVVFVRRAGSLQGFLVVAELFE